MTGVTIWHNPRCSKSRATLKLIEAAGLAPEVRLYLADPPSVAELRAAAALLGLGPRQMIRAGEAAYRAQGLEAADDATLFAAMAATPVLIERPVVFAGGRAAIGRPPEAVLAIL